MTATPHAAQAALQTWCVLIHFEEKKVTYLVHTPTEEQQRGYHHDRLYPAVLYDFGLQHLKLFTAAVTADYAKFKAKQLLLEYVQVNNSPLKLGSFVPDATR